MKRMSTPQLLMIEDDARLAHMVGEYLTQSGFLFSHAGDGASGLELLQLRQLAGEILARARASDPGVDAGALPALLEQNGDFPQVVIGESAMLFAADPVDIAA